MMCPGTMCVSVHQVPTPCTNERDRTKTPFSNWVAQRTLREINLFFVTRAWVHTAMRLVFLTMLITVLRRHLVASTQSGMNLIISLFQTILLLKCKEQLCLVPSFFPWGVVGEVATFCMVVPRTTG